MSTEYRTPVLPDGRNSDILVHVGGRLVPREEAAVSVFDSVVQGGDAVWEGLRVYEGKIAELNEHLDRLFDSAHALAFRNVPTREAVMSAVFETLRANGMRDGCHIRLTLTRGKKVTSGMDPRNNQYGCTLIVLAEWKAPVYSSDGIRLVTAATRRNTPQILDSKIHHNNILNNIVAKIEANVAGADDAIMLDLNGFVAETNATNVFVVRRGHLITPTGDSCLPGITRGLVLRLARAHAIPVQERNVSLTEVYTADEVFTTGTMGELSPVLEVDGRQILNRFDSRVTKTLQALHAAWVRENGYPIPE
ncbi:MAG: aminotransferase IV [Rhodothermales bacterium]|nr:aminotransferase IV [Rhodothermales bacterium]